MKWSMASVGVIVLGIIGVMVIVLFQQLTTSSENDYYLLKEITEASMIESIDLKLFDKVISDLLEGKKVKLPTYNFVLGKK